MYIGLDFIDELEKLGFSAKPDIGNRIIITDINHVVEYNKDGQWRHFPGDTIGHEVLGKAYAEWHDFKEFVPYFERWNIKRESNIHNFDKLHRLITERDGGIEGMSGLGPLDTKPDPELASPQEIAREKFLFKLRQVIKGQFYDDSVKGGYDFVGDLQADGYKGKLKSHSQYWEFTKEGEPITVRFYYEQLGGLSLNIVVVRDKSRNQQLFWNRVASPQYTDTVADIVSFMDGHRPGTSQSFSESA